MGGFPAQAIVEESFSDELTISGPSGPLKFQIVFEPDDDSVSAPLVTQTDALAQMEFTLNAGSVSLAENVCASENGSGISSCGGGWQAAPSPMMGVLTTGAGDEISLSASLDVLAHAEGNSYNGATTTATATSDFPDAQIYIIPLNGGTVTSQSGASYREVGIPEPPALILLATAIIALLGYVHRAAPSRADG